MPDVFDIPEKETGEQCTAEEFNAIVEAAKSVKIYVAMLNQEGENDPVATVLNGNSPNFLGNIVWTREGVGEYIGTLPDAFPIATTYMTAYSTATGIATILVNNGNPLINPISSEVYLEVITSDTFAYIDERLLNVPVEIRVCQ